MLNSDSTLKGAIKWLDDLFCTGYLLLFSVSYSEALFLIPEFGNVIDAEKISLAAKIITKNLVASDDTPNKSFDSGLCTCSLTVHQKLCISNGHQHSFRSEL